MLDNVITSVSQNYSSLSLAFTLFPMLVCQSIPDLVALYASLPDFLLCCSLT